MIKWRIYYTDGTHVDDKSGLASAPTRNVIGILLRSKDCGRVSLTRWDYYYYENTWWGGDLFGLWDYLTRPGMKKVLFGRTIDTVAYDKIMSTMLRDPDFPPNVRKIQRNDKITS